MLSFSLRILKDCYIGITDECMYEVRHWNGLRWQYIFINFHDDRFRHLSNIAVITATIWEAVILVLLI
jgi:hypothetical protein